MSALSPAIKRLVVVMPSWVGDVVMSTPVLRALRERRPDLQIIGVMQPGLDQLLDGCPDLDESVTCVIKGLGGAFRLGRTIQAQHADAVLLLPNSFRVALGARLARVPIRIGFDRDGRGRLLTHGLPVPRADHPTPTIEYYAQLAASVLSDDAMDLTMHLSVTDAERDRARSQLGEFDQPYVVLNPGANRIAKRWPAERFAAVADALHTQYGLASAVSGAPREREVVEAVIRAADPATHVINLVDCGVDLGSLKSILADAKLLITNDTGPRHIAAALGTPVVTLFGPTDHRWTSLPQVVERCLLATPFLPEEAVADQNPTLCRIERITVGDVLVTVAALRVGKPRQSED